MMKKIQSISKLDFFAVMLGLPIAFFIAAYTPLDKITNGRCQPVFDTRWQQECLVPHFAVIVLASFAAGNSSKFIYYILLTFLNQKRRETKSEDEK